MVSRCKAPPSAAQMTPIDRSALAGREAVLDSADTESVIARRLAAFQPHLADVSPSRPSLIRLVWHTYILRSALVSCVGLITIALALHYTPSLLLLPAQHIPSPVHLLISLPFHSVSVGVPFPSPCISNSIGLGPDCSPVLLLSLFAVRRLRRPQPPSFALSALSLCCVFAFAPPPYGS